MPLASVSFAPGACLFCVNLNAKKERQKLTTIINKCAGLSKYLNKKIWSELRSVPVLPTSHEQRLPCGVRMLSGLQERGWNVTGLELMVCETDMRRGQKMSMPRRLTHNLMTYYQFGFHFWEPRLKTILVILFLAHTKCSIPQLPSQRTRIYKYLAINHIRIP